MKRFLLIGLCILFLEGMAFGLPEPFEKARNIALSGKQSKINSACWFWERQVAKDSIDLIFVIGYCKNDNSFLMAIIDGPKIVMLTFNGIDYAIFLLIFGQIADVIPVTEEKAVEFAEQYFKELISFKLIIEK